MIASLTSWHHTFKGPGHVRPLATELYHVIGLRGRHPEVIGEILEVMDKTFSRSDVEVHKRYSARQVNVYVRAGAKASFDRFVGMFPAMEAEELKPPTTFLAHSERMRVARQALERFIDDAGIVFWKPNTPVISNHDAGVLTTAAGVRNGILAATDKIMMSRATVDTLKGLHPDVIVELGLGGKSLQLLMHNDVDIPCMAYTGTVEQAEHLLHLAKPPVIAPAAGDGRDLGHDRRGAVAHRYLNPGEQVVGFGEGGSESLTMFIKKAGEDEITVRKVLSEALLTTRWSRRGEGVMLPPFVKARKQFEYLRALPDTIRHYFPQAYDIQEREIPVPVHLRKHGEDTYKEVIYEMSYVPGKELSQFIGTHLPAAPIIARIYEQILVTLNRDVHAVNRVRAPGGTLESSYFSKIESRLALCRRTAPLVFGANLTDTERININGTSYLNSSALLKRFRRCREFHGILEPRFHALVVGDTNTENIKITSFEPILDAQRLIESGARRAEIEAALNAITSESIGIKFLDPRSIGFKSDGAYTRDDPMYDTKIWHNSVGHYDEIHHEYFDMEVEAAGGKPPRVNIEFNPGNSYRRVYQDMEDHFGPVMQSIYGAQELGPEDLREDPYWLVRFVFVMGTHFMAMPPFHFQSGPDDKVVADSYHVQRRPVALYCEGIQWLNWALEILEGRRREFMGVEVPPLPYSIGSLVA